MAARIATRATYPYTRKGGLAGAPINPGFAGDSVRSAANFARLTDTNYAYTPFVPPAEANVKVPAWLNSPIYYHNRGNSDFWGESSLFGDFVGLDDLMTENPRVVQGFIDIFGDWIERYGIDGFRIDTARHVNPGVLAGLHSGDAQSRARTRHPELPHLRGSRRRGRRRGATRATHARRQAAVGAGFRVSRARSTSWWPAAKALRCWRGCTRTTACMKAA